MEQAAKRLGGLDVVCCNTGVFPQAALSELAAQNIDDILHINLRGTMLTVKEPLKALRKSPYGRVIVTSSITGPITGYPGRSHYGCQ